MLNFSASSAGIEAVESVTMATRRIMCTGYWAVKSLTPLRWALFRPDRRVVRCRIRREYRHVRGLLAAVLPASNIQDNRCRRSRFSGDMAVSVDSGWLSPETQAVQAKGTHEH